MIWPPPRPHCRPSAADSRRLRSAALASRACKVHAVKLGHGSFHRVEDVLSRPCRSAPFATFGRHAQVARPVLQGGRRPCNFACSGWPHRCRRCRGEPGPVASATNLSGAALVGAQHASDGTSAETNIGTSETRRGETDLPRRHQRWMDSAINSRCNKLCS